MKKIILVFVLIISLFLVGCTTGKAIDFGRFSEFEEREAQVMPGTDEYCDIQRMKFEVALESEEMVYTEDGKDFLRGMVFESYENGCCDDYLRDVAEMIGDEELMMMLEERRDECFERKEEMLREAESFYEEEFYGEEPVLEVPSNVTNTTVTNESGLVKVNGSDSSGIAFLVNESENNSVINNYNNSLMNASGSSGGINGSCIEYFANDANGTLRNMVNYKNPYTNLINVYKSNCNWNSAVNYRCVNGTILKEDSNPCGDFGCTLENGSAVCKDLSSCIEISTSENGTFRYGIEQVSSDGLYKDVIYSKCVGIKGYNYMCANSSKYKIDFLNCSQGCGMFGGYADCI